MAYTAFDHGFDKSLKTVTDYVKANGPFDGILAFSQGSAFLVTLLLMMEQQKTTNPEIFSGIDFKFAILIAGFRYIA